jgi:hypothetical protein
MTTCPICGKEIREYFATCPYCGYRIKDGFTQEEQQKYTDELRSDLNKSKRPEIHSDNIKIKTETEESYTLENQSSTDKQNWFKRHLHWTMILVYVIAITTAGVTAYLTMLHNIDSIILNPEYFYKAIMFSQTLASTIGEGVMVGGACWVLKQKNRSLWWSLLQLLPVAGISIFMLENRSKTSFKS